MRKIIQNLQELQISKKTNSSLLQKSSKKALLTCIKVLKYVLFFVLFHHFSLLTVAQAGAIPYNQLLTPLEKSGFTKLTTYNELVSYLKKIDSLSAKFTLKTIGKSVEGRDIPLIMITDDETFGSKRSSKSIVFIYAQQHGDEPSGKEAALILSRELAVGSLQDLLQNLDVLVVPLVNPDGAEKGKRKNANDQDLNRNHAILSEPESYALHSLFLEWMPEVTLDVHEYNAIKKEWISNGFVKDADEMLDWVSNLNIAPPIVKFSREVLIPEIGKLIQEDGFSFHRYIVGAPFGNQRIRHSTTAINDGRQSMGIYNTLSFILEGKQYGNLITNIERRTKGQVSALTAFLKTVAKHHAEILRIIGSSRQQLLENSHKENRLVHIQMDYFPDPEQKTLTFPVFDLYTWQHVERQLENYEPVVRVKKSIKKPYAYIFSKNEHKLIDLLLKHQIEMSLLRSDVDIDVEAYVILHVTPSIDEDKPAYNVDVSIQEKTMRMERGSVVVFLNQKAANLIPLLLEPQSSWSIVTPRSGFKYHFAEYLYEGNQYPIFRLMNPVQLDMELYKRK